MSDDDLALLEQAAVPPARKGRETWKAEVVDEGALFRWLAEQSKERRSTFLVNDSARIYMPALNAIARQQKSLMKIPGVRAVSKRSS